VSIPGDLNADGSLVGDDLPIWKASYSRLSSDRLPGMLMKAALLMAGITWFGSGTSARCLAVVATNSAMVAADKTQVLAMDRALSQLGGLRLAIACTISAENDATVSGALVCEEPL
jgi:hypothetical protein